MKKVMTAILLMVVLLGGCGISQRQYEKDVWEEIVAGELDTPQKLNLLFSDDVYAPIIFSEHGYQYNLQDSGSGISSAWYDYPEQFENVEKIKIISGAYKIYDTDRYVDLAIHYKTTSDEENGIDIVKIYPDDYYVVDSEMDDEAYDAETIEEVVEYVRQDIDAMFEEFILQAYGCTYQVNCGQ